MSLYSENIGFMHRIGFSRMYAIRDNQGWDDFWYLESRNRKRHSQIYKERHRDKKNAYKIKRARLLDNGYQWWRGSSS